MEKPPSAFAISVEKIARKMHKLAETLDVSIERWNDIFRIFWLRLRLKWLFDYEINLKRINKAANEY